VRTVTRAVKHDETRQQVRDLFGRVLRRDPEVRTSLLGSSFDKLADHLLVELRDNLFILQVQAGSNLVVAVHKTSRDRLRTHAGDVYQHPALGDVFFQYSCPMNKMGKLRKVALILLKKMQHVEIHEVMNA
jgi:hypothetical protein